MLASYNNMQKSKENGGYDTESDVDSLTEDLDQIGRFNLNIPINLNITSYIHSLPNLPSFDIRNLLRVQDVSKEISKYISTYTHGTSTDAPDDHRRLINSVKTAISSRIQMNNFLNDLNLGLSLSTAIDRLQPLTDIIHETIFLPAEDTSDFEDDYDMEGFKEIELKPNTTEPVGVDAIVNRHQPLVSEIVKPDNTGSNSSKYKKRRKRGKRSGRILSDPEYDSTTGSDLDNVEGLTLDEVKALTHLDSLDDFYQESLLRRKIQKIQGLKDLSQQLKNKLVTRLMMGNYYKYVNENLAKDNKTLLPSLKEQQLIMNPDQDTPKGTTDDNPIEDNQTTTQPCTIQEASTETETETETEAEAETTSDDDEDAVMLTEKDQEPSFHDPPFNKFMGCSHYQRNCKVECPTCLKWFPCRFCHDAEITTHKLVRADIRHILCMKCNTPQLPEHGDCISCESELANYFCAKCKLYDNDPTKDIYHCDKCGICRLGLGLGKDFYHCDECNICLSIDLRERHKCLTNTTHCNCPVCNEYLFTSVNKVVFMKCGHLIHQMCYDELSKHSYKCPVCKKTVVNVETQFRILDQEIRQLPLPAPYNHWRCIVSCNDCKGKSNVLYHVLGLKCKYCKSYNTNQLKLIKPEEEDDANDSQIEAPVADQSHAMRLIQTNLQSNFRIDDNATAMDEGYVGDTNKPIEELEHEPDRQMFANIKRLTNSFMSNLSLSTVTPSSTPTAAPDVPIDSQSSVSYITSILQGFVNSATSGSASYPNSPPPASVDHGRVPSPSNGGAEPVNSP